MTNNIVLDVTIGLTFIYLLYSLLASTINEFVAIILAYRSRMLERGIEQMLDGKSISYYWWDKVANSFLWINYKLKTHEEDKFKTGEEKTKADEQNFFLKTGLDEPNRTKYKRVKLNAKARFFAANITRHPLYKRSTENSLLYKKPAYLSSTTFSDILLDIFRNNKTSPTGEPLLMKDVVAFIDTKLQNNPDLKNILTIYAEQANGDVQRFKFLIENWYDSTMQRVSGWYKKQANKVLFIIGLLLAILFNISTIEIVNKLSADKTVRDAFVESATKYIDAKNDSISAGKNFPSEKRLASQPVTGKPDSSKIAVTDSVAKDSSNYLADQNTNAADTGFEKIRLHIDQMKKLYTETIEPNNALGLGWDDFGYKTQYENYLKDSAAYAQLGATSPQTKAPKRDGFWRKFWYVVHESFSPRKLIGFLITALAISLGAPFWFDLLNRFVNLRVSGKKPEDSTTTTMTKTVSLNQKPDPTAKG